jgi:hypothetical protein
MLSAFTVGQGLAACSTPEPPTPNDPDSGAPGDPDDTPQLVKDPDIAAPPPSYDCLRGVPVSVLFSAYACNADALCCVCSDSVLRGLTSSGVDGAVAPACPDADVVSSPPSCCSTQHHTEHSVSLHNTTLHSLYAHVRIKQCTPPDQRSTWNHAKQFKRTGLRLLITDRLTPARDHSRRTE